MTQKTLLGQVGGGGHFNFYINPELDKQKNMNSRDTNPIYRQEITALLENLNLADSWRVQNPNTRRYTWHSRGKSSRLDFKKKYLRTPAK